MIAGQNIGCNVCDVFHIEVSTLVHGTFESYCYQLFSEERVLFAIVDKYFEVALDVIMDIFDDEKLLYLQIFALQYLG
jgi:hypothetical protein